MKRWFAWILIVLLMLTAGCGAKGETSEALPGVQYKEGRLTGQLLSVMKVDAELEQGKDAPAYFAGCPSYTASTVISAFGMEDTAISCDIYGMITIDARDGRRAALMTLGGTPGDALESLLYTSAGDAHSEYSCPLSEGYALRPDLLPQTSLAGVDLEKAEALVHTILMQLGLDACFETDPQTGAMTLDFLTEHGLEPGIDEKGNVIQPYTEEQEAYYLCYTPIAPNGASIVVSNRSDGKEVLYRTPVCCAVVDQYGLVTMEVSFPLLIQGAVIRENTEGLQLDAFGALAALRQRYQHTEEEAHMPLYTITRVYPTYLMSYKTTADGSGQSTREYLLSPLWNVEATYEAAGKSGLQTARWTIDPQTGEVAYIRT